MSAITSRVVNLNTADWQRLQIAVAELERDPHAQIDDILAAHADLRDVLLVELVHADLERRLRAGESVLLESYFERYPELSSSSVPDLVLADYRLRREIDPLFDGAGYSTRFPDHASTIQSLLEQEFASSTLSTPIAGGQSGLPQVPGYEVRRVLGRGGMGVVYEAWDRRLRRTVALKMLLHGDTAAATERLRREAAMLAAFVHPNIVQIFDVGDTAGRTYLALEYVPSGNLAERLAKAPMEARSAAELVGTLAQAVQSAHERGIIHRDIKPGNVLLQSDGTPKLNDFGLAKPIEDAGLTETGAILGTPGYMAPEQTQGEVTALADVYSLGAVLYECLAGRPPFRGATPLDTLALTREAEPIALRVLQPKVPRDLETIALKCLRKLPTDRYDSASALAVDLERYLASEPIQARPVSLLERGGKWAKRHPAPTLLAGLLIATIAGAIGLWASYTHDLSKSLAREQVARGEEATARAEEAAARRAAVADRNRTLDALQTITSSDAGDTLVRGEGVSPAQRAFFENSISIFRDLAAEPATDPDALGRIAWAQFGIGTLSRRLDLPMEAEAAYIAAESLFIRYAELRPDEPRARLGLARCLWRRAQFIRDRNQFEESISLYRQSIATYERLIAAEPALPVPKWERASVLNGLSIACDRAGRPGDGLPILKEAVAAYEAALADMSAVEVNNYASAMTNIGYMSAKAGDRSAAQAAYRKAIPSARKPLRWILPQCTGKACVRRFPTRSTISLRLKRWRSCATITSAVMLPGKSWCFQPRASRVTA